MYYLACYKYVFKNRVYFSWKSML